jgi:hypothetical protein
LTESTADPRLKLIEILATLGGFLGVIASLEHGTSSQFNDELSVTFVVLIVTTFLAYSAIVIKLPQKQIKVILARALKSFFQK